MPTGRFRFFLLLVSAACAGAAVSQFLLVPNGAPSPAWGPQFLALIATSVALSLLILLLRSSPAAVITLLLLKFVALTMIGIPEGRQVEIIGSLALAYMLELVFCLPLPYNRIFSTILVLAFCSLRFPVRAWDTQMPRPSVSDLLSFVVPLILVAFLSDRYRAWAEASLHQNGWIRHLDEAIMQLTNANMGFQQYAETVQRQSAAAERDRITREIHDTVGYTLINIMMMMEEASLRSEGNPSLKRLHDQTKVQAQTGLKETRRALQLLRSVEHPPVQTIETIRQLVTAFQSATGVTVSVEYGNIPRSFDESVSEFVIHMLQEGMANALRHGKASRVRAMFWMGNAELIINLHDNGMGSELIKEGIGFSGMRERVAALGGRFEAGNVPDGFQITARIPYSTTEGAQ